MTSISLIQKTRIKAPLGEKVDIATILHRPWLLAILYEPGYCSDICHPTRGGDSRGMQMHLC